MKKFLTLFIVAILLIIPVSITACVATTNTVEAEEAVQPRLNKKVTIALDNTWTDIPVENNLLTTNLTVANHTTSSYAVQIRIVSSDYVSTLCESKEIASGSSEKFSNLSAGGYIIQGKAADDVIHEYTLTLSD